MMELNMVSLGTGAAILGVFLYLFAKGRRLANLKNRVDERWAESRDLLELRQERLIKALKIMGQSLSLEQATLKKISEARALFESATAVDKCVQADQVLSASVIRLMILADRDPKLRTNDMYTTLEKKINRFEKNIAECRDEYNHAAREYNARIAKGIDRVLAKFLSYTPSPLYPTSPEDRTDVSISYKTPA